MTLIYVVFLGALIIGGCSLGILTGTEPIGVALLPALVATFLVVLCLSVAYVVWTARRPRDRARTGGATGPPAGRRPRDGRRRNPSWPSHAPHP